MIHHVSVDLHSDNAVVVMIDDSERRVLKRKFKLDIPTILSALEPYKQTIKEIGVEATYKRQWQ